MLLLIKLTSFAFNYHNGTVTSVTTVKEGDLEHTRRVKQAWKQFAVPQIPSLLKFLGFVYCFTTFPAFEYKEYSDAIHQTRFEDKNDVRRHVSPTRAVVSKLMLGLGLMELLEQFGALTDLKEILSDENQSMPMRWG